MVAVRQVTKRFYIYYVFWAICKGDGGVGTFDVFYSYQTKARNQGNTETTTNPVFDLQMTSYDLE